MKTDYVLQWETKHKGTDWSVEEDAEGGFDSDDEREETEVE